MYEQELSNLIALIYDAAVDFDLWAVAMARLADAVGANTAAVGIYDSSTQRLAHVAARVDPEYQRRYLDYWATRNFLWEHSAREPVGRLWRFETFVAREDFNRSAFYNEWWRPQAMDFALGTNVLVDGPASGVVTAYRSRHAGDFDGAETRLFALLAPHFQRATQLHLRLTAAEIQRTSSAAALDRMPQGAMLVDAAARVLFANRAAEAVLASRRGLRRDDNALAGARPGETAALRGLIAGCLGDGAGGLLALSHPDGHLPIGVLVVPLRTEVAWLDHRQPAAIVFISDPERSWAPSNQQLITQFGLTPAEAAVAVEIVRGNGIEPAAKRLGVSLNTARTHLMHVFAKTGTSRQAALVRLLLQSGLDLRID
jgi:DNA-binding CsgD family transcriptional regulator/PAS domain-containing protein